MLLHNLHLTEGARPQSILVREGRIQAVTAAATSAARPGGLHFEDAFAFPGLINSHDHLDFNCFPMLGNHLYPNYVAWGNDIHARNRDDIDPVLRIPQALRVQWGLYKNLLNGITTVVHHGARLPVSDGLISVFQKCHCLHSVGLEQHWRLRLNHPGHGGRPIVIHIGEGTDRLASEEITELIRWNIFRRPLIGVHGVAMSPQQARHFQALVWCPASNFFLLGKTAAIGELKAHTRVVFGTDSTLTGSWNLYEHLRRAKATGMATGRELLAMLTTQAALVWNLPHLGQLSPGRQADLVVARRPAGPNLGEGFCQLNPEDILLVMHRGEVQLFDASLYSQIKPPPGHYHPICAGGAQKFVKGKLPALLQQLRRYHPEIGNGPWSMVDG